MQTKKINPKQHYIIRIDRGEEVMEQLTNFCQKNNIYSGSFHGIGACSEAEFGYYSVELKGYNTKVITEEHEVTSIIGTISDKKIHAHATISDKECSEEGGHVDRMIISATCEIHLIAGDESLSRKMDDETGLELLDI
jgi:uncharacterized protein